MPKAGLYYLSSNWYTDLKEYLEIVVEDSESRNDRVMARSVLRDIGPAEKKLDAGYPVQVSLSPKQARFVGGLTEAVGMYEASEEFGTIQSTKRY